MKNQVHENSCVIITMSNGKRTEAELRAAIDSCMRGEKLKDIAVRHGVQRPTVCYWLRRYGLKFYPDTFKLPKPGRRRNLEPSARDKAMFELNLTYQELANIFRISRSRVIRLFQMWADRGYKVPVENAASPSSPNSS